MALSNDVSAPYAPASAIVSLLERHRTRGLPNPVDKSVLERAGISPSLVSRTLQSLVVLDLIAEDGSHTEVLENLRLAPEADYSKRMVEWLNAAYADILQYVDPSDGDEMAVRDAFRPYNPHGQQDRMVTLFTGLYGIAGAWPADAQRAKVTPQKTTTPKTTSGTSLTRTRSAKVPPASSPTTTATVSSGKALEYQLVDLMTEAVVDKHVLEAIVTVITFLKTKDAHKLQISNQ